MLFVRENQLSRIFIFHFIAGDADFFQQLQRLVRQASFCQCNGQISHLFRTLPLLQLHRLYFSCRQIDGKHRIALLNIDNAAELVLSAVFFIICKNLVPCKADQRDIHALASVLVSKFYGQRLKKIRVEQHRFGNRKRNFLALQCIHQRFHDSTESDRRRFLSEVLQQCIVAAAFYDRLAGAVGVGLENNTSVVMEFA